MGRRLASRWLCLIALSAGSPASSQAGERPEAPISFRNDVMAVLSKAGCNMGVCHGNKNGKGGFKLSLRGEDPNWDFAVLSRDLTARRINRLEPDASLLLLKPTMQLPHEGARRFKVGSREYEILRRWIAAGSPADPPGTPALANLAVEPRDVVLVEPADHVQLSVEAVFSDGSRRDVKSLAVYDTSNSLIEAGHDGLVERRGAGTATVIVRFLDRQVPVRVAFVPARPDFAWQGPVPANFIDEHVFARLKALRIYPSPRSSDSAFLRRAFLDLLGILPTADEARQFAADAGADKRARLIDNLLERPEFADAWALKWADLLRVEEKTLDRKGVQNFHAWIRGSIARDKPLDQFARELIASRGSTYRDPAANYYRAMRDPFMRAESTAQVFLGVRLQCSKCHNHPFDRWTQDDYYRWANLFARVEYRVLENRRRDTNDSHEFDGEQIVIMAREGDVKDPRTNQPPAARFLAQDAANLPGDADRLVALADWLANSSNRQFVETLANRIWYHLLGQGIVDPIDDFRSTNPPVNPQLLSSLATELASHNFSLRHLIRTIMNSEVYQLSATLNDSNREDDSNFSRARALRLTAEQSADAMAQVAGVSLRFAGYPEGLRAGELPGVNAVRDRDSRPTSADQYLKMFGKPPRLQACDCERSNEPTLSQTFGMVTGSLVMELIRRRDNRLGKWLESNQPAEEIMDELFWTALSRPPTAEERRSVLAHVESQSNRREAFEDILWALMNTKEFLFRL
ncbi:MAG: DUF1549 domain-containing protein [Planctomycetia bacterium]|nr:DUF1549 domain-containing protein [Planctomycetia bacterium]